jgi:TPR repeat protein
MNAYRKAHGEHTIRFPHRLLIVEIPLAPGPSSREIHLAGVRFAFGVLMKARLLLLMSLVVLTCVCLFAQQNPNRDPKQEGLAICAHLKLMSQREFQELISKGQSGDAAAQYQVGLAYEMGVHVSRDDNEAARWFLKSAEQCYPPAEGAYGLWIRQSNRAVGERWMLRAAEHSDASAQLWLGVAYEQDWFGTVDAELALKWYRRAAESGDPDAQVVLGEKYEDGEGVEQSYELAAKWFRNAAEHVPDLGGAGQGRNHLGLLYMEGRGVPRDYARAYFWFSLNGPGGNANDAKAHLSADQIKATDTLVREWNEQHRVSPEVAAAWNIAN